MEPQDPNVEASPARVAESGYRVVEVQPADGPLPVLRLHPALTLLRGFAPADQAAATLVELLGRDGAATCVVEVEGTPMPAASPPAGVVLLTMARLASFGRGPGDSPEQMQRRAELRDEREYFERRITALRERLKEYALERDAVTAQFGAAEDLDALANEIAGALEVMFAMPEEAWPLDPVAEELAREWASLAGERLRRGIDKIPPPDQAEVELAEARAELERLRGDGRLRSADVDRIQELHARVGEAEQAAANAKRAKRDELEIMAEAARAAERDALAVFGLDSYSAFLIEMGRIGVRPEFEAEMRAAERAVVAAELRLERSHMLASDRNALEAQEKALRARAATSLGIDFDGDLAQVLRGKRLMPVEVRAAHDTLSVKLPIALRVDPALTEQVPTEGGNELMAEAWLDALAQAPSRGPDRHDEELRRHQIRLSAQEDACRDELAYLESGMVKVVEEFDALLTSVGQDLATAPADQWEAQPLVAAFDAFRREEMPPRSLLVVDDVLGGLSANAASALFDALVRVTAVHQVVIFGDAAEVVAHVRSLGDRAGSWTPDDARRLEHQRAAEAAALEARALAEAAEESRAQAAEDAARAAGEAEVLARREAEEAAGHANAAAAAARAAAQAQEQARVEAAAAAARVEEAVTAAQAAAASEERARVEAAAAAAQAAAAATAAQVAMDAVRHARAEVAAAEARAAVHEEALRRLRETQTAVAVALAALPEPTPDPLPESHPLPESLPEPMPEPGPLAVTASAFAPAPEIGADEPVAPAAPPEPAGSGSGSPEWASPAPFERVPAVPAGFEVSAPAATQPPAPQWAQPPAPEWLQPPAPQWSQSPTPAAGVEWPAAAATAPFAAPAAQVEAEPHAGQWAAPAGSAPSAPQGWTVPSAEPRAERPPLDEDEVRPPGWSLAETLAIYRSGEADVEHEARSEPQAPPAWAPAVAAPWAAAPVPEGTPEPAWMSAPVPEAAPEPAVAPDHIYDQRPDDAARATASRLAALLDGGAWEPAPEAGFAPAGEAPATAPTATGAPAPAPWSWEPPAAADEPGANPMLSDGPRLWSPDPGEVRTDLLGAPWNPPEAPSAPAAFVLPNQALPALYGAQATPPDDEAGTAEESRGGLFGRLRRRSSGRAEQSAPVEASGPAGVVTAGALDAVPMPAAGETVASGICQKHRVETDEKCRRCKGSFCNQCLMPVGNKLMCIDCAMVVAGLKRKG